MELRHLRYFVVVAEEGNFTRAAAKLHIQQPPLSQQIQALEEELGFELLVRHPKGARLTPAGAIYLREARAILRSVEQAGEKAANIAAGITGTLSIGLTSSAAAHPSVPLAIRQFRHQKPNIQLEIKEGNASQLTQDLENDKLDVAFIRRPVTSTQTIAFHTLLLEEMLLVLPIDHPLLKKKTKAAIPTISLTSLKDEKFILVRRPGAPGMYANLLNACERLGFTPKIRIEIDRMLTNITLVAAGEGVSIVPATMQGFHIGNVAYCHIKEYSDELSAPLNLAILKANDNPVIPDFFQVLSDVFKSKIP